MKLKFIFFSFIAFCLVSCQKDFIAEENITLIVSPVPDSNYLHKIYAVEYTDTPGIITFKYDGNKRVKSIIDSFDISPGSLPAVEIYTYFYNGSSEVPFKVVTYIIDPPGPDYTDSTYFFFDALNRKIRDSSSYSFLGDTTYDVYKYSYLPGSIIVDYKQYSNGVPPYYMSRDTLILSNSGNIITSKKYEWNGSVYVPGLIFNFTYDNFKSPFIKSNFKKVLFGSPYVGYGSDFYFGAYGNNNIVTTDSENFQYLYNPAGYPVKKVTPQGDLNLHYTYKSL